MKKNMRQILIAILCCLLTATLFCSCGKQQPHLETVEVTMEEIAQNVETEDGILLMTVKAKYPVLTADVESELIPEFNQLFQERAEQYVQGVLATYLQEGAEDNIIQRYLQLGDKFQPYGFEFSAETTYQQNGIISFLWSQYSYLGGAHPYTAYDGETYDLNTGEPLSLGDLLEMKDDKAYAMVEQRYQGVLQAHPDDFFPEASQFVSEHIQEIEYYLDADGVNVFFQVYDVAPYAAGRIDIIIGE